MHPDATKNRWYSVYSPVVGLNGGRVGAGTVHNVALKKDKNNRLADKAQLVGLSEFVERGHIAGFARSWDPLGTKH